MSTRAVAGLYWAWMGLLAAAFLLAPGWSFAVWTALSVTGLAAVVVGIRRNRPRRPWPWMLIAAGVAAFCAGDVIFNGFVVRADGTTPFPSVADLFYLGMVPLLAAGLAGLARSGVRGQDRANLIDALTLTLGLGLLAWIYFVDPYVDTPGLTTAERLVSVAYPLGDILILLTGVGLVSAVRRSRAVALLAVGAAGMLLSDAWYGAAELSGTWQPGGVAELGWIAFYAAWGGAALDPSMARLTEPGVARRPPIAGLRLVLLAASSFVPPAVLLVQSVRGEVRDGVLIAVLSALMYALVLARLAGVVTVHRHALARERALRAAGAALVSAADVGQVHDAVRDAVTHLLPPGAGHRTVLAVGADQSAEAAAQVAGLPAVVTCPLPSARTCPVGQLAVAADAEALGELRPALEVLAAQAALAVERLSLSDEVNRRISEEYFRTLVHNSTDVILILADGDRVRYATPSAARLFGRDDLTGVHLLDLVDPRDRGRARHLLDGVREGELSTEYADWLVLRADGTPAQVEVACRDLRDDPSVGGLVATIRDVTERRRLEAELSHRSLHDALTGLANRVLFGDRVHRAVQRAQRNGTLAGVLFIDLDDFKVVNDTLGHERGDQLLVGVGERLAEVLREHDTAARLGGDEFAILVEDATHPGDIENVADRVLAALAVPIEVRGEMLNAHASVGVAISAHARDATDLLRQADLALYLAKSEGKHQWRRYEATLHTVLLRRLELRAALDQAVSDEAFALHFQPIVALASAGAVGVEALVRWDDPQRGLVSPAEFIDVAEESGLIVPIGAWVLRTALATLAGWRRDGVPGSDTLYVSVNVSVRQFRAAGFIEHVRAALDAAGLAPEALMLEITESLLLRDDEQVWTDLAALRALGVRVAIDDFGTGYSSLSYLRQVPIDILKIDRSFIQSVAESVQQAALVDGIIRLAHTLGLQVVAEGIEDATQRDLLLRSGCELGQGYLFARPMTAADAVRWLAAHPVAV